MSENCKKLLTMNILYVWNLQNFMNYETIF